MASETHEPKMPLRRAGLLRARRLFAMRLLLLHCWGQSVMRGGGGNCDGRFSGGGIPTGLTTSFAAWRSTLGSFPGQGLPQTGQAILAVEIDIEEFTLPIAIFNLDLA